MSDHDVINHPSHYAEGRKYEPIDVFLDWGLGPLEWQVCKYLSRLGRKGDALEDARKAQFYMNRLVEQLEAEQIGKIDADVITDGSVTTNRFAPGPVTIHFDGTDIDPDTLRVIFGSDFPARL